MVETQLSAFEKSYFVVELDKYYFTEMFLFQPYRIESNVYKQMTFRYVFPRRAGKEITSIRLETGLRSYRMQFEFGDFPPLNIITVQW
jgi:hypothetical protein